VLDAPYTNVTCPFGSPPPIIRFRQEQLVVTYPIDWWGNMWRPSFKWFNVKHRLQVCNWMRLQIYSFSWEPIVTPSEPRFTTTSKAGAWDLSCFSSLLVSQMLTKNPWRKCIFIFKIMLKLSLASKKTRKRSLRKYKHTNNIHWNFFCLQPVCRWKLTYGNRYEDFSRNRL